MRYSWCGARAPARPPPRLCRPGHRRDTDLAPRSGIIVTVSALETRPGDPGVPASAVATSAHAGLRPLVGMSPGELRAWMQELGEPAYRGAQIARWLYGRGAREFAEMTDLPAALRERLAASATTGRARTAKVATAPDGTVKLLQELADDRRIETVMLPYSDRTSVCISSQVGCPVG